MEKYIEYIGYLATAFVLLSFMMRNIVTLRIVSIIGCALFLLYGFLKLDVPIIITNSAIIVINVLYLKRHYSKSDSKQKVKEV